MGFHSVRGRAATALEIHRRRCGFSRAELAKLAFIHRETLARIERRESTPHPATLNTLAAILDVSPEALKFPPEGS